MAKNSLKNYDDAWLNLGDLDQLILPPNPMIGRSKRDIERPDYHLIKLLKNPKYLGTTVKLLFNIELHPMQIAVLQELWSKPFPMFIATRGFSKLLRSDELIRIKNGWKKMEDIEIVLESPEDAKEAINLLMGKKNLFEGGEKGKLKDIKVTSLQRYETSAVDYKLIFLLEFLFEDEVPLDTKVAMIKQFQEFFKKM